LDNDQDRQGRRQQIIDAAEEIIFSEGLERATMDDIAEAADIGKGTLYYYFKNKTALYLTINGRGLRFLNQRFAAVLTEDEPGIELVRRLGEEFIKFVRSRPHYFDTMMRCESLESLDNAELGGVQEVIREREQQIFAYTLRALQAGIQDGTIESKFNPHRLAIHILANVRGLTQLYNLKRKGHYGELFQDMDLHLEELFEESMNLMIDGMKARTDKH